MKVKHPWPKSGVHQFTAPLFKRRVWFTTSRKTFQACLLYFDSTQDIKLSQWAAGLCRHSPRQDILVGVFDNRLSTLVHELGHVAFYILDGVRVPVKAGKPNETYCYTLDEMFAHFAKYMRGAKP